MKKNSALWLFYACILCLCYSRTTAMLTAMYGLAMKEYFLLSAALITAVLLVVYLPCKLLAGRFGWNMAGSSEQNVKKADWLVGLLLVALLVFVRILLRPGALSFEGQACFMQAKQGTGSLAELSAGGLYSWVLAWFLSLFGKEQAVFACNLTLQAVGGIAVYMGLRKHTDRLCAVLALCSIVFYPAFANCAYTAEPQNLLLILLGILLLCKNRPKLCGLLSGAAFFIEPVFGSFLLFTPACLMTATVPGFLALAIIGFVLFWTAEAFWVSPGGSFVSVQLQAALSGWLSRFFTEGWQALLHSPTLRECWMAAILYLFAFLALFGNCASQSRREAAWVLPIGYTAMIGLLRGSPLQEQGISFLFFSIMAGNGIRQMLTAPETPEEELRKTGTNQEEILMKKKEKQTSVLLQEESAPPSRTGEAAALQEAAQDAGAPKERYLQNPLPGPKKHVRKAMEYTFEPDPDQLFYDTPVADDDDFDLV